jgi:IS5 family transposase
MKQTTFASTGFELVTKSTRKREFLDEMNLVVPWTELTGNKLIRFNRSLLK